MPFIYFRSNLLSSDLICFSFLGRKRSQARSKKILKCNGISFYTSFYLIDDFLQSLWPLKCQLLHTIGKCGIWSGSDLFHRVQGAGFESTLFFLPLISTEPSVHWISCVKFVSFEPVSVLSWLHQFPFEPCSLAKLGWTLPWEETAWPLLFKSPDPYSPKFWLMCPMLGITTRSLWLNPLWFSTNPNANFIYLWSFQCIEEQSKTASPKQRGL